MENTQPQPESSDKSKMKQNVRWTDSMDRALIQSLAEQAAIGNKVDKNFKAKAYTAVSKELSARFGMDIKSENIRNRLRTIKKQYIVLRTLMGQSGFCWDPVAKIVTADEQVWNSYLQAHPNAAPFRGKPIDLFDQMAIVVGNDQPTGSMAKTGLDLVVDDVHESPISSPDVSMPLNEDIEAEEVGEGQARTFVNISRTLVSSPASQQHGKKARGNEDIFHVMEGIKSTMDKIASALQPNAELGFTMNLHSQVMKVEGFPFEDLDDVFGMLNSDDKLARAFMTRCEAGRRRMIEGLLASRH